MSIKVSCPACQATYKVPTSAAGKQAKCKSCGATIDIPATGSDATGPPPSPGVAPPPPPVKPEPDAVDWDALANAERAAPGLPGPAPMPGTVPYAGGFSGAAHGEGGEVPMWLWGTIGGVAALALLIVVVVVWAPWKSGSDGPAVIVSSDGTSASADGDNRNTSTNTSHGDNRATTGSRGDNNASSGGNRTSTGNAADSDTGTRSSNQITWDAGADPMPALQSADRDKPISILLKDRGPSELLFPDNYGVAVALGVNRKPDDMRNVFDLYTGAKIGVVKGELPEGGAEALRSDGMLLAVADRRTPQVILCDTQTGRITHRLDLGGGHRVRAIHFLKGGQVAVVSSHGVTTSLKVFAASTGQITWSTDDLDSPHRQMAAVSPGGAYMVVWDGRRESLGAYLYRAADGAVIGKLHAPKDQYARPKDMRFSPDGEELAALIGTRIVVWRMSDGQQVLDRQIPNWPTDAIGRHTGTPWEVEWLPERKGWLLVGRVFVWREPMQVVNVIERDHKFDQYLARRLLDNGHLLSGQSGGTDEEPALRSTRLITSHFAHAARAKGEGKKVITIGKQSLVERSAATFGGQWQVDVDPTDSKPAYRRALQIPMPGVHRIFVAREHNGKALATRSALGASNGSPVACLVEMGRGTAASVPQLGGKYSTPAAISPDGSRALIHHKTSSNGSGQVQLWDFSQRKIIASLADYAPKSSYTDRLGGASFIDNDRVALFDRGGHLSLWNIPEARCEYIYTSQGYSQLIVTPGGKYAVLNREFALIELATGEVRGRLEVPEDGQLVDGVFSADGQRLAGEVRGRDGGRMFIWKMTDGRLVSQLDLPRYRRTGYQWVGEGFLLLGQFLYDIEAGRPVWEYTNASDVIFQQHDERVWLATSDSRTRTTRLIAYPVPSPAVRAAAAKAKGSLKPLVAPGMTVKLSISFRGPSRYADDVRKNITHQLTEAGFKIAGSGQAEYRVEATARRTGQTQEFFGGARAKLSIMECTISRQWIVGGKVVWRTQGTASNEVRGMITVPRGTKVEDYINDRMWKSAAGSASSSMPARVLPPMEQIVAGKSKIDE